MILLIISFAYATADMPKLTTAEENTTAAQTHQPLALENGVETTSIDPAEVRKEAQMRILETQIEALKSQQIRLKKDDKNGREKLDQEIAKLEEKVAQIYGWEMVNKSSLDQELSASGNPYWSPCTIQ